MTADLAIELELNEGFVPLIDARKMQEYLATWDPVRYNRDDAAQPWTTYSALMMPQLLSCVSAKFCQPPLAIDGAAPSSPVLGQSQAFFQRLVVYNPAFRKLSMGADALGYTDLLGETTALFSFHGIGRWLRDEKLLKVHFGRF